MGYQIINNIQWTQVPGPENDAYSPYLKEPME